MVNRNRRAGNEVIGAACDTGEIGVSVAGGIAGRR